MSIIGNAVGTYSPMGKTFVLVDENGVELTGVVVGQETVFTATDNDVREGFVYASDGGVSTGTKNIPAYRTTQGMRVIMSGQSFSILLDEYDMYDYTALQCIIAKYNVSSGSKVSTDKVVIFDNVYEVNSTTPLSNVTKNANTKSIDLNIVNNTNEIYVIHLFSYKEEV